MSSVLTRYRVMAYVVGVLLVVLVLVAMPLKYLGDEPELARVVGIAHGWLFMVYIAASLQLARHRRWPMPRTILVLSAGLIPFLSFLMERRVTRELQP
jgi:integral membrane protein